MILCAGDTLYWEDSNSNKSSWVEVVQVNESTVTVVNSNNVYTEVLPSELSYGPDDEEWEEE